MNYYYIETTKGKPHKVLLQNFKNIGDMIIVYTNNSYKILSTEDIYSENEIDKALQCYKV